MQKNDACRNIRAPSKYLIWLFGNLVGGEKRGETWSSPALATDSAPKILESSMMTYLCDVRARLNGERPA